MAFESVITLKESSFKLCCRSSLILMEVCTAEYDASREVMQSSVKGGSHFIHFIGMGSM